MDEGHPIHYMAVPRGTPVYGSDGVEVGHVVEMLDNRRENIFDGVVFRGSDGRTRFADAPEVARTAERAVTLTIDSARPTSSIRRRSRAAAPAASGACSGPLRSAFSLHTGGRLRLRSMSAPSEGTLRAVTTFVAAFGIGVATYIAIAESGGGAPGLPRRRRRLRDRRRKPVLRPGRDQRRGDRDRRLRAAAGDRAPARRRRADGRIRALAGRLRVQPLPHLPRAVRDRSRSASGAWSARS